MMINKERAEVIFRKEFIVESLVEIVDDVNKLKELYEELDSINFVDELGHLVEEHINKDKYDLLNWSVTHLDYIENAIEEIGHGDTFLDDIRQGQFVYLENLFMDIAYETLEKIKPHIESEQQSSLDYQSDLADLEDSEQFLKDEIITLGVGLDELPTELTVSESEKVNIIKSVKLEIYELKTKLSRTRDKIVKLKKEKLTAKSKVKGK